MACARKAHRGDSIGYQVVVRGVAWNLDYDGIFFIIKLFNYRNRCFHVYQHVTSFAHVPAAFHRPNSYNGLHEFTDRRRHRGHRVQVTSWVTTMPRHAKTADTVRHTNAGGHLGRRRCHSRRCGWRSCLASDSTAYLANQWTSLIGSELGVYTATQRPDFQPIFTRLLPKCVCLRDSAPDPTGGAYSAPPPHPSWKRLGHTPCFHIHLPLSTPLSTVLTVLRRLP